MLLDRGGSRKIHAPGVEGPGKGELVHLGGKQWEIEVSTWVGSRDCVSS